jgi:hypothetical protein
MKRVFLAINDEQKATHQRFLSAERQMKVLTGKEKADLMNGKTRPSNT